MVSNFTSESYDASAGALEVVLDIPALSIAIPTAVSHTTSYPNYLPTFDGQFHGGYSYSSVAYADLNLEAVLVSTGVVVGRAVLGTAVGISGTNNGNYYTGDYFDDSGGGGYTSCLVGTSLIEMSDGSFKQIKDIKVGDFIKSLYIDSLTPKYSEENNWRADDITNSNKTTEEVLDIQSYVDKEIYNINNGLIECTHSHKHIIKQNGVWCIKTTDKINVGDIFLNSKNEEVEITSITINEKTDDVYNIRVSGKHTYYVNGILTHNVKLISAVSVTGDTKITLPKTIGDDWFGKFDMIHVDGGHDTHTVVNDFIYTKLLAEDDCVIVFDDYNYHNIREVIDFYRDRKVIVQYSENLMETDLHYVYKF
jgi:hypothetical protein